MEEEKKDEGLDALIKTKKPVQSVGVKWYPTADLKGDYLVLERRFSYFIDFFGFANTSLITCHY
jgi:hypothetical protein